MEPFPPLKGKGPRCRLCKFKRTYPDHLGSEGAAKSARDKRRAGLCDRRQGPAKKTQQHRKEKSDVAIGLRGGSRRLCVYIKWVYTRCLMELHSESKITPRLSIMKFSLFLGCVVLSILAAASGHTFDSTLDEDWKNWKSQHEKQYTEEEETYRRLVWEDSMRYIEQHNLEHSMGKHTFTVGMNQFGDLTTEEFNKLMNGFLPAEADNSTEVAVEEDNEDDESNDVEMDAIVDWRTKGYVTPVKNQGQCGSCWAFSANGALEGQWYKTKGQLVHLSEQNLVDCSRDYNNEGCNGGWMDQAYRYVLRNNGVNSAATYPYTGRDESCKFQSNEFVATISGYRYIVRNEFDLKRAVETVGPIAVAIDAGQQSFQYYKTGVYYEQNCEKWRVNHAVLVVGYGTEGGLNYWIVKNSWGTGWGDQGYIKMAKDKENNCGIANYAIYPIV
uniref:digestive cysteine proteinase 2-like isoform X1 n=2 Tax=Pristiophorus japonicus TaxID=55135 RepID=UPI00398EC790